MSASTCFEYGEYHFFPLRRFNKGEGDFFALSKRLERDFSLGLFDYKDRQKYPYTYDEFYKVTTNPNYDIFCCVENGKIYVPATHELFIYHNPNDYHKREQKIIKNRLLIDTKNQYFDLKEIDNRRFMYNPKTGIFILVAQFPTSRKIRGSYAEDLTNVGIYSDYDDYVRGWVGVGKGFPHGVIHFAPNVDDSNNELYSRAFDTLEMFAQNGADTETIVRAFGKRWEQLMCMLGENNYTFTLATTHPGLVDLFLTQVRQEYDRAFNRTSVKAALKDNEPKNSETAKRPSKKGPSL